MHKQTENSILNCWINGEVLRYQPSVFYRDFNTDGRCLYIGDELIGYTQTTTNAKILILRVPPLEHNTPCVEDGVLEAVDIARLKIPESECFIEHPQTKEQRPYIYNKTWNVTSGDMPSFSYCWIPIVQYVPGRQLETYLTLLRTCGIPVQAFYIRGFLLKGMSVAQSSEADIGEVLTTKELSLEEKRTTLRGLVAGDGYAKDTLKTLKAWRILKGKGVL